MCELRKCKQYKSFGFVQKHRPLYKRNVKRCSSVNSGPLYKEKCRNCHKLRRPCYNIMEKHQNIPFPSIDLIHISQETYTPAALLQPEDDRLTYLIIIPFLQLSSLFNSSRGQYFFIVLTLLFSEKGVLIIWSLAKR